MTPYSYPGGRGALVMESWTIAGPYTGRGPKGYKRSNEYFVEEASQRLERDGQIDASEIEVTAEDGVITLRGTVPDRAMKRRAEECVESIYGVHDVANELRVSRQGSEQTRGGQGSLGAQYGQLSESSQGSRSGQSSSSTGPESQEDRGKRMEAQDSRTEGQGRGSRPTQASSSASSGSTATEPADDDKKSRKDKQH